MAPLATDPTSFTLAEARSALEHKKISAHELASAFVNAVEGARPREARADRSKDCRSR
jgi:hypothetical protein